MMDLFETDREFIIFQDAVYAICEISMKIRKFAVQFKILIKLL